METNYTKFKSHRLSQLFKSAVTLYTGVGVKKLHFVEVKGTSGRLGEFAIQAEFERIGTPVAQFLVHQQYVGPNPGTPVHEMTPEQIADILEEVNFSSWPPKLR